MKVAFQGLPGAYSEAAVLEYFGQQTHTLPCESFEAVFAAVQDSACEGGLLPIENSVAGSIHRNYDLLLQHDLSIVGEYYLRVQHCWIALPGVQIDEVRSVISDPQALAHEGLKGILWHDRKITFRIQISFTNIKPLKQKSNFSAEPRERFLTFALFVSFVFIDFKTQLPRRHRKPYH